MSRRKTKTAPRARDASPRSAAIETPEQPEVRPEVDEPSRRELAVWAGALFALMATLATWGQFDFSDMMGYYDLFAQGLENGRLSLMVTPDQANLVDMIPYKGRYYFQWGPFPVIFHLAARTVGLHLSDRVACLLTGWLSSLVFLACVLLLRRRHFPKLPKQACFWFLAAFALATPNILITIRGTVYSESIGVAALMILCAFYAYLRYSDVGELHWALASGAFVALAALARATTFVDAVPFFLAFAALDWLRKSAPSRTVLALALFSLPVLAAGGATMALNQARFGSPTNFGLQYKPESVANPAGKAIRFDAIPESLGHYLFSLPKLSSDFPYIEHVGNPPVVHVTRAEAMSSIILGSPFVLLGLFAATWLREREDVAASLRTAAGLSLLGGAALFLFVLTFAAASRRYSQDFMPLWMIAAFLGFAALWTRGLDWNKWRAAAWIIVVPCALLNIQVAFYQSFVTPTPDINVNRIFVALTPMIEKFAPGPRLHREAAIAAHDMATISIQQGDYQAAVEALEKAARWMPDEPRIQHNLELARRLAGKQ